MSLVILDKLPYDKFLKGISEQAETKMFDDVKRS